MKSNVSGKPTVSLNTFLATVISSIVIIVLLCVVLIISLTNQFGKTTDTATNTDGTSQTSDADDVDYSVLKSIDSQGVIDFLAQKQTGLIYAGRPTCPYCQQFAPVLTKVVKDRGYTVYYYDTDANNGTTEHATALSALEIEGVPTFLFIRDGVIADVFEESVSESALINFVQANQ